MILHVNHLQKGQQAADRVADLKTFIPPPNRHLQGTWSWITFFLERDARPARRPAPEA